MTKYIRPHYLGFINPTKITHEMSSNSLFISYVHSNPVRKFEFLYRSFFDTFSRMIRTVLEIRTLLYILI